ncbi:GGDEF domain-containing protein [Paenibacillus sp. y28]|uniref:GGDEF domain-containing protein n=1 Tax=Paenibacillus sp. y28 TaxID=3129110 RepID=UPI003016DC6C
MQQLLTLFTGSTGHIFSYSSIILILAMMIVMSVRLYLSRRRIAYLSLTVSIATIIIQYLLLIGLELWSQGYNEWLDFCARLLQVISFILINTGIYQLYNSTKRKQSLYFWISMGLAVLIGALHFLVPLWLDGSEMQMRLLQNIWLDLYLFILILTSYYFISPWISQLLKYQTSLILYFAVHTASVVNTYLLADHSTALTAIQDFLPIFYYFMLFLILFERTVELLQAIYQSSITDGLTGLYNRRFFYRRVSQYVARGIPVYIIFSDIDNFKKLNDTRGHQMGDDMLKKVAQIMSEESEDIGVSGRYGGEEMVMLVTDASQKIDAIAERFRRRVEEETIVTVSVGVSLWKNGVSAEELIKQADEAMYRAKTTGKNKVVKFA